MKTKIFTLILISALITSCGNKKEDNVPLTQVEQDNTELISITEKYKDSLDNVSQILKNLAEQKLTKEQAIANLSFYRDSIKAKLESVKTSISDIKNKKLNANVNDVTAKLNEIKGIKEGLVSQTELKNQEIDLAKSKVEILNKEKIVYDNQKRALFDKGAAPESFVEVDSLLQSIDSKITLQNALIRNLNRTVTDNELEINRLDNNRKSLSEKIRKSYDAEKILNDYNEEEATRLEELISNHNNQIDQLSDEASSLNTHHNILKSKTSNLQQKVTNNLERANQENQVETTKEFEAKKSNGLKLAIWIIGGVFVLMIILYVLGKKRKNAKKRL